MTTIDWEHPDAWRLLQSRCISCDEGTTDKCPKSVRPCGHHCNHMWTHDVCDWCGASSGTPELRGGGGEGNDPQRGAVSPAQPAEDDAEILGAVEMARFWLRNPGSIDSTSFAQLCREIYTISRALVRVGGASSGGETR